MCDAGNISCQSFAYVCAHSLQAEAACVALGTSNGIKTFIHEDLTLFSLLYQSSFPSSVPQYFLSESIQFRSLLAPVVRDNGPVWPLMRPSFPLQLQKGISTATFWFFIHTYLYVIITPMRHGTLSVGMLWKAESWHAGFTLILLLEGKKSLRPVSCLCFPVSHLCSPNFKKLMEKNNEDSSVW